MYVHAAQLVEYTGGHEHTGSNPAQTASLKITDPAALGGLHLPCFSIPVLISHDRDGKTLAVLLRC